MSNRIIMAAAGASTGGGVSLQNFVTRIESTTISGFNPPGIAVDPTTREAYLGFNNTIIKFNANGTLAWQRSISITGNTPAIRHVEVLTSAAILVIADGTTSSVASVIRLNASDGTLISGFNYQTGFDILVGKKALRLSDGSYLVMYDNGGSAFPAIAQVAKYSSSHVFQWTSTVADATEVDSYFAEDISVDPNGNFYFLTVRNNLSPYIYKLNSDGTIAWLSVFSRTGIVGLTTSVAGASDGVYVLSSDQTNNRFNLVKLNSSTGTITWERSIAVTGTLITGGIRIGSDGNVYVVATLNTTGIGAEDYVIYKLDSSGNSIWQRAFGTSVDDASGRAEDIIFDGLGNYYITGDAASNSRVYIARLPIDGTLTGTYTPFSYNSVSHTVSTTSTASVITATSSVLFNRGTVSTGTLTPTITTPTTSFTATRTLL